MTTDVRFWLNGELVTIEQPSPDLLLIDYLRSPDVGLTGAKKGCGQGGCGACTVILSGWDEDSGAVQHRAINSCLRPVCALSGLAVTTIEGTGAPAKLAPAHLSHQAQFSRQGPPAGYVPPAVAEAAQRSATLRSTALARAEATGETGAPQADAGGPAPINQVALRLAMNNGTQCGYCTTGFVMNMSALLAVNPSPTKKEIEDLFDGNICRCTGYRSILTGMKTFASDWTDDEESRRMQMRGEASLAAQFREAPVTLDLAGDEPPRATAVEVVGDGRSWVTPETIEDLCRVIGENRERNLRLVRGNTSFGIYPEEFLAADVLVDIGLIADLHGIREEDGGVWAGAGVTYRELIETFEAHSQSQTTQTTQTTSRLGAAWFMARRTAGSIVRNAASLGGNSMLVLSHIHSGTGAPFPSDLMTALLAIGARVSFVRASTGETAELGVEELIAQVLEEPDLPRDLILTGYHLPFGDEHDIVLAQKVALREVNAHSLVNATTRLTVDDELNVTDAVIVLGGIGPYPWRASQTEYAMTDRPLTLDGFAGLAAILTNDVEVQLATWRDRSGEQPWEGVSDAYRIELAVGFLYKAIVNALNALAPDSVPLKLGSSGVVTWGMWPPSDGTQHYETQPWKAPVSVPYVKLMALYQATGRVHYTHEAPLPPTAVNAAFVQSRRALADYHFVVPGSDEPAGREQLLGHLRERFGSTVDLITHEQLPPHGINAQGMGADQPLFAVDRISYYGQAIALAIATTEQEAITLAEYVSERCIAYRPIDWMTPWDTPVLSLDDAIRRKSIFPDYPSSASFVSHVWRIIRPGSQFRWVTEREPLEKAIVTRTDDVDGRQCTVVESTQRCGGQAHFYMETQACVAIPLDGDRLLLHPSSQSPMGMHQTAAMALGVHYHQLEIDVLQLGGGYGGKTEPARFVTGPAAVAARHLGKPVRLAVKREHDTALIGKRHAFYGQYQIAVDDGADYADDRGRIRGLHCNMWGDGGAFYDCSFVVTNCMQLRADNAYHVANFQNQIDVCRTNTAPNTAMRAFGDIQNKLLTENAIDDAAFRLNMRPEEVRKKNLYNPGDVTPFGQALSYCYMQEVWDYLEEQIDYEQVKQSFAEFNAENTWRKVGFAMVPVKYGSGYNFAQIEQAAAHIAISSADGSVVVHQGAVEMGQGAHTIIEQVASYVLNVPMDLLHIESANTSVLANPSSTGASTGTSYNAEAVKQTCEILRSRLTEFGYSMLKANGPDWCTKHQIDFWNYPEEGWATEIPGHSGPRLIWQNLVQQAYAQRVSLVAAFTAPIVGGETPVPALTFKPMGEQPTIPGVTVNTSMPVGGTVGSFTGFTYSAACSMVEVDILTGEVKILKSDLVYDAGWSLNPAIDIGQIEGAFVQGIGYVMTEELVYEPEGDEQGRLNTLNTWRYKPPATTSIPLQMNTYLFPRDRAANVPDNAAELFSSKEIGEPPLVLAASVFFAIKDAIRASRLERGLDGLFEFGAPATPEEVRRACAVTSAEMEAAAGSGS